MIQENVKKVVEFLFEEMKKVLSVFFVLLALFCLVTPVSAHSGKTDANGGHNSSSGYHYHHGYPAHKHTNGTCPYDFDDKTNHDGGGSSSKTQETEKSVVKQEETKAVESSSNNKTSGSTASSNNKTNGGGSSSGTVAVNTSGSNSTSNKAVVEAEQAKMKYMYVLIYIVSAIFLFSASKMLWPIANSRDFEKWHPSLSNVLTSTSIVFGAIAFPFWIIEAINRIPKERRRKEHEAELARKYLEELSDCREASTASLERKHRSEVAELEKKHSQEIKQYKDEIDQLKKDSPETENEYKKAVARLKREHAQDLRAKEKLYISILEASEAYNRGYAAGIARAKAKRQEAPDEEAEVLNTKHQEEINALNLEHNKIVKAYKKQIRQLKEEVAQISEIPHSEQEYKEAIEKLKREHAKELDAKEKLYISILKASEAYDRGYADGIAQAKQSGTPEALDQAWEEGYEAGFEDGVENHDVDIEAMYQ